MVYVWCGVGGFGHVTPVGGLGGRAGQARRAGQVDLLDSGCFASASTAVPNLTRGNKPERLSRSGRYETARNSTFLPRCAQGRVLGGWSSSIGAHGHSRAGTAAPMVLPDSQHAWGASQCVIALPAAC